MESLNASILAESTVAARRASYYCRNNSWVTSAVQAIVANAVGCGIKPRSKHPNPAVRDALHVLWNRWTDEADAAGLADFYGLQAMAVRAMVETGEVFARLRARRNEDMRSVPLQVELIDREQVPLDRVTELSGGTRIRAGIEFDAIGRRVAYHVLKARPGDPFAPLTGNGYDTTRVPAADIIHLFQPLAPGQLRGITWLSPVLLRLHELEQYEDATVVKAKIANLFTGFLRDPGGDAGGQAAAASLTNNILQLDLEPGEIFPLPPGTDITFSDPIDTEDYGTFVKNHLRGIASGLGVPYEAVSGDLEGVNYSSIRAGLVEFRRRVEQLQHNVIAYQFCRPIWERFVTVAVLSGALPARDFEANPAPYLSVEWLPPRFEYVDPKKDVEAEILAVKSGLKSRSQSIAERGYDAEQVDAEIAAERQRAEAMGLSFESLPTSQAATPAEEDANA
ncbi:phage portal protein [Caenispirillum bisanense]